MSRFTHDTGCTAGASAEQRELQRREHRPCLLDSCGRLPNTAWPCDRCHFGPCDADNTQIGSQASDASEVALREKPVSAPRSDRRSDPEDGSVNARGRPACEPSRSAEEGNADAQANTPSRPDIDGIKARARAATLGPWFADVEALCAYVRERDARAERYEAALRRIAEATPANTNSRTAHDMQTRVHAVASVALLDDEQALGADR